MKKFWKKAAGFTLVELIVVIAILGVLAGVAVPAYSGYVKKANLAADQTLLDSVNTAFAAACMENLVDINTEANQNNTKLVIKEDKTVDVTNSTLVNDTVKASFGKYYGADSATAFKVVTTSDIKFDPVTHMFTIDSSELQEYTYGSGKLFFSGADVEKLGLSIFIRDTNLGVDGLMAKVNDVTGYAVLMAGNGSNGGAALNKVLNSSGFHTAATNALKLSDPAELEDEMERLAAQMIQKNPGMTPEQAAAQVQANAAVLYAAQNTTKMSTGDVTAMLADGGAKDKIVANLNSDEGLALSQAAIAYGMYTAYAYRTGDATLIGNTSDPVKILHGLDDEGFLEYINGTGSYTNGEAQTDLAGYMSSMNMINSSTQDPNAVKELMVNGFADPNLANALKQSLGQ